MGAGEEISSRQPRLFASDPKLITHAADFAVREIDFQHVLGRPDLTGQSRVSVED